MSISELIYRELENGKIITVNFICNKLNLSKKEGFEILRRFTNAFVQTKQINCFLLKQITGKKNNKSSCSLVKSCDLEEEKKLFQSIDCISGWLMRKNVKILTQLRILQSKYSTILPTINVVCI